MFHNPPLNTNAAVSLWKFSIAQDYRAKLLQRLSYQAIKELSFICRSLFIYSRYSWGRRQNARASIKSFSVLVCYALWVLCTDVYHPLFSAKSIFVRVLCYNKRGCRERKWKTELVALFKLAHVVLAAHSLSLRRLFLM